MSWLRRLMQRAMPSPQPAAKDHARLIARADRVLAEYRRFDGAIRVKIERRPS